MFSFESTDVYLAFQKRKHSVVIAVELYRILEDFRHIERELKNLLLKAVQSKLIKLVQNNLQEYDIYLVGPKGSAYAEQKFTVEMFLPESYPRVPPIVRFITKIKHPQIDQYGYIRNKYLGDKWSPSFGIPATLMILLELLREPCGDIRRESD
ncbi:ubiquitin-conjugating enzyme E2 35 [Caerostris extrusa]|uniref:Ubiquitin-conjugating enzyme E2 35 n=1 Tax=Caerostris extrusa TaxID=172846 RepID=A0AAV4Q0C9_CAEEX|nr:ubiquitin-conjugating enzyme E2 35 [Caerostris extrusa]